MSKKTLPTILFLMVSVSVFSQITYEGFIRDTLIPYQTVNSADIDNNGTDDLIIGTIEWDTSDFFPEETKRIIEIYLQSEDGNFLLNQTFKYDSQGDVLSIDIVDLNNDNIKELILGYSNKIGIYYQDNLHQFKKVQEYETYAFVNDSAKGISPGLGILKNAAKNLGVSPAQTTLKDCGYRKINKGDYEILVDTGNIKPNYQPGHAHSDALNFCIYYKGAPLIVDTGTSTYDLNKTRKEERSTAAHNTVLYNDLEPTQTWGAFRVGKRALVSIIIDEKNTLEAQHNGYKSYGIIHNRNFFFEENEIIIKDYLFCNCSNTGQAYIHIDHACEKPIQSGNTVTISDKCNILFENYVKIETLTYKHANGFNQFKSAYYLKISFIDKLVTKIRLY